MSDLSFDVLCGNSESSLRIGLEVVNLEELSNLVRRAIDQAEHLGATLRAIENLRLVVRVKPGNG